MKKTFVLLLVLVLSSISIFAADTADKVRRSEFGLGICVGEPIGINFKFWTTEQSAFSAALGWQSKDRVYFHLDYLIHNYELISKGNLTGEIPFYWGGGLRLVNTKQARNGTETSQGVRIVLGINYIFKEIPIDFFGELVPTILLSPDVGGMIATSMGIRYYFE